MAAPKFKAVYFRKTVSVTVASPAVPLVAVQAVHGFSGGTDSVHVRPILGLETRLVRVYRRTMHDDGGDGMDFAGVSEGRLVKAGFVYLEEEVEHTPLVFGEFGLTRLTDDEGANTASQVIPAAEPVTDALRATLTREAANNYAASRDRRRPAAA